MATPIHCRAATDEAELHATGTSNVIAAFAQLDLSSAVLEGTQLEVFASFKAFESCIIGVGGALWQTFVGLHLAKAIDAVFAGAARELGAVLAAYDELAIVGKDVNCRPDPCSEKAVATVVDSLALALFVALVLRLQGFL